MAGLLDFLQTPTGMGLLSAAAGTMAGARRGQPWNTAGRGVVSGLMGYSNAQDQIRADEENAFAKQYKQMQMEQMQAEMARRKATQEAGSVAAERSMTPGSHGPLGYQPTNPQAFAGQFAQGGTPEDDAFNLANIDAIAAGNNALAPVPPKQFDPNAYSSNMMAELAQRGFADDAMKYAPKQREPLIVSGRVLDPVTFKPLYEPPQVIDYNKPFLPDGRPNPAYQEYATNKARAGASRVEIGPTRVENITTQESEGSKVYGKGLGEMQIGIQQQGFQAPTKIANLDRMSQLLEGVDSGRLSGAGLEAARFAKSFGLNVDPNLGNKQAAEALAIEMALQMREPGSGPMTDKDFNNYLNTVPNLAKTADGRKQITATLKAKAKRDIEISKMARAYAKQNRGVIDDAFLDQVAEYMAQNPVVQIDKTGAGNGGWSMRKK